MLEVMTPEKLLAEAEEINPSFRQFWKKLELEVCRILVFRKCVEGTELGSFHVPGLTVNVGGSIPELSDKSSTVWSIYEGVSFLMKVDADAFLEAMLSGAGSEIEERRARHEARIRRVYKT